MCDVKKEHVSVIKSISVHFERLDGEAHEKKRSTFFSMNSNIKVHPSLFVHLLRFFFVSDLRVPCHFLLIDLSNILKMFNFHPLIIQRQDIASNRDCRRGIHYDSVTLQHVRKWRQMWIIIFSMEQQS